MSYAQIVPDNTLPVNSQVELGCTACTIEGGTVRGSNLFHSFQEFSVVMGGEAYFNNDLEIDSIFSRVTGNSLSEINGLIRTNEGANLFLINPHGIAFGSNTRLEVAGSFIASTAESISFQNGYEFSSANPEQEPNLTVNFPTGLNFRGNVKGISGRINSELRVPNQETLALLGGNIELEGTNLRTGGREIEIGSIKSGSVAVKSTPSGFEFGYDNVPHFQDIAIIASLIGTSSRDENIPSGNIRVRGRNITLSDSEFSSINISNSGRGSIKLIASGLVDIKNTVLITTTASDYSAQAGNISIQSNDLIVGPFSSIRSATSGSGDAGQIDIQVEETTTLTNSSEITGTVTKDGVGRGSSINLDTHELLIDDNSRITTSTKGQGDAGSVNISVWETATLDHNSTISSEALRTAIGNAGSVVFEARNIRLDNGSGLSSSSTNNFDSGDITVTTTKDLNLDNGAFIEADTTGGQGDIALFLRDLIMRRGSLISASATGEAPGGNIEIDVENLVALENSDITSNAVNNIGGNISINAFGIFGTGFRDRLTPESDIVGTPLNTPDLDPSNNLEELPETIVDPETLVSASPCPEGLASEFILGGSGGIPPNPSANLTATGLVPAELSAPSSSPDREAKISSTESNHSSETVALENQLVPAWGWVWNDKGEVVLTAYNPTAIAAQRFPSHSSTCSGK